MVALVPIALIGLVVWYWLANRPAPISSDSYELTKALFAACNLEDPRRLEAVETLLSKTSLPPGEHDHIREIVDTALDGRWQDAMRDARELLDSQDNL